MKGEFLIYMAQTLTTSCLHRGMFMLRSQYLKEAYPETFRNSRCNPQNHDKKADGSIGLFTDGGRVTGSSISGIPSDRECCYLFISGSFDLSWDSSSQAYVTIHEMYHIFQISNIVGFDYDLEQKITGFGKRYSRVSEPITVMRMTNTLFFSWFVEDFISSLNQMISIH